TGRGGSALVIMMSAYGGEEAALAAMKEGAYDYIPKPFRPDEVILTLRKAEERERLGNTIATLKAQLDTRPSARALVVESPVMRGLQEGGIGRVGDQRTRGVDVRVLAATARDLAADATAGRFRHDLFDRLNVVTIHLPPLAERREDIAPLAQHFATQVARRLGRPVALTEAAVAWLREQPWPGNVRSLEHAIERAAVLSDKEILEPTDFRKEPLPAPRSQGGEQGAGSGTLRDAVEAAE